MAGNFEIDEQGMMKAEIGIRGRVGYKDRVQHLVNRAARSAYVHMKLHAPEGQTGAFKRAIDMERASFRPGGSGGGGSWVAVVGLRRTPETRSGSRQFSPGGGGYYPSMVFQGTGVYGPRGRAIKTQPGNVMVIEGYKSRDIDRGSGRVLGGRSGRLTARPGILFTHQVLGQRPQQDWYHDARDRANLVIASNLHRIFHMGDSMDDI